MPRRVSRRNVRKMGRSMRAGSAAQMTREEWKELRMKRLNDPAVDKAFKASEQCVPDQEAALMNVVELKKNQDPKDPVLDPNKIYSMKRGRPGRCPYRGADRKFVCVDGKLRFPGTEVDAEAFCTMMGRGSKEAVESPEESWLHKVPEPNESSKSNCERTVNHKMFASTPCKWLLPEKLAKYAERQGWVPAGKAEGGGRVSRRRRSSGRVTRRRRSVGRVARRRRSAGRGARVSRSRRRSSIR